MSCSDNEDSERQSVDSEKLPKEEITEPPVPMLNFIQKLFKKFRVLKKLTESERQQFEQQVIKLLVDQEECLDPNNYKLLVEKQGLQTFVLEILAEVIQRQPATRSSKLQKDLKDINEIIEQRQTNITKKQKILQEKEVKINARENELWQILKTKTEKHQKDVLEAIGKKEQELIKKVNANMRSLKIKQEIVKQKIEQLSSLQDKSLKIETAQKKLKEKIKVFQKKEQDIKKRQSNQAKHHTQIMNLTTQLQKAKAKIDQLNKKISSLNHTLSQKTKIILLRDAQIERLKTQISTLNQKQVERLQIKGIHRNQKQIKTTPRKLLNEELNISQIIIYDKIQARNFDLLKLSQLSDHLIHEEKEQQSNQLSVNLQNEYIQVIQTLMEDSNTAKLKIPTQIKKILFSIMCRNIQKQCNQIKKYCLDCMYEDSNQLPIHLLSKLTYKQSQQLNLYTGLVLLFSTQCSTSIVEYLNSLSLTSDQDKLQLVLGQHLLKIIQQIGLKNLFDQVLNSSIVQLMLRTIQRSEIYEKIMAELCLEPYTSYLQIVFEKYDMEQDIIQNLSVLISRICIFRKIQLRQSFIKSLKMKMKVLGEGLTKMNLQSILGQIGK